MPADRTSVSTGKLCALCEGATGLMIWRRGLRSNASTKNWWCSHDGQLPANRIGSRDAHRQCVPHRSCAQRSCRPTRCKTYGL